MSAPDSYIGRVIENGKYQILQKIGSGGMGAVYKAMQTKMGRLVALKILHPKLVGRKDLASRFSREAKALGGLTHPNTVKVFDDGVLEDGSLYIVMEFLEGRNLNQTVRLEGPMAVNRALPILIAVCGALEEAHQRGIVHRDLKPENIFLCNQGGLKDFPKVLDFGLAKVTEREMRPGSIILTREGMVFGTPEFMSPEQAQGQVLDARSDIYSLAVILYEVLTGKLPFEAKNPMEFIRLHVMHPPIPLDQRVPGLVFPPGLGNVIQYALAKNPEERFASVGQFAEALDPYTVAKSQVESLVPISPRSSQRSSSTSSRWSAGTTSAPRSGPALPVPGPVSTPLPSPAPLVTSLAPSRSRRRGVPWGLTVGVATLCLMVGVLLALLLLHFVKR